MHFLMAVFMGNGIKILVQEYMLDQDYTHFLLLILVPVLFAISLVNSLGPCVSLPTPFFLQFFTLQLVQNITMIVGPIAHYFENSRYYSAIPPKADKEVDSTLPHITIQMPVYKEGLEAVLCVSPGLSNCELPHDRDQGSIDRIPQACDADLRQTGRNVFHICE